MRQKRYLTTRIATISMIVMLLSVFVASAWATVSFVKPQDVIEKVESAVQADIPEVLPVDKKARAPEPSTMVLFGSGFLGMVASFIRRTYAVTKRVFDVVASFVGMIIVFPLVLLTALLVKLTSKGPVFYSQVRVGKDGSLFNMYKFRTMKVDAEKDTGPVWAQADDNRLTPVGGLLRKSHIDELPQFLNVLRGEMSLIGPRPERPKFVDEFKSKIPNYENRLSIKPGITGLAQVWHRYDETILDVKKKLRYDLLYIRKMCMWADFSIMLRTFRVVFTGEGAR